MNEIPALRDALVGAAARRVRRRRRTLAVAGWTAVAAAIAAVLSLGAFAPSDPERPAARGPEGLLERAFPVFARAPREGDALPHAVTRGSPAPFGLAQMEPRLALADGADRVWLVAGRRDGQERLCVIRSGTGRLGNGECRELTRFARAGAIGWAQPRGHEPGGVLMALPAGARDARVTLSNGLILSPSLRNGVALVRLSSAVEVASWTDAAGVRHIERMLPAKPHRPRDPGCPRFGALPADADTRARRAALLVVDSVYPQAVGASVTGVAPLGPGLCTRAVTDRTLVVSLHLTLGDAAANRSASLTQGRLLVGMLHGRMTVWSIQH